MAEFFSFIFRSFSTSFQKKYAAKTAFFLILSKFLRKAKSENLRF
jgi:hypothetical protein